MARTKEFDELLKVQITADLNERLLRVVGKLNRRANFVRDAIERAVTEAELQLGDRPNVPPEVEVVARGLAKAAAAEREGIEDDPLEQEAIAEAEWPKFVQAAMDVLDEVQQVTGKKR